MSPRDEILLALGRAAAASDALMAFDGLKHDDESDALHTAAVVAVAKLRTYLARMARDEAP